MMNEITVLDEIEIEAVAGGNPVLRVVVSAVAQTGQRVYNAGYAVGKALYEATHD